MPFVFDKSKKFLPVCLMTQKVNNFENRPLVSAGYGLKKATKKKLRDFKTLIRFNKSSSVGRGITTRYTYNENYGKPAYTLLKHFKPGKKSIYKACTDDPKRPDRPRNFTICTFSRYSSTCTGRQLIYLPYFFNFLLNFYLITCIGFRR